MELKSTMLNSWKYFGVFFILVAMKQADALSELLNPRTFNLRATLKHLESVYSAAIVEVDFLSHTTYEDRKSVIVKSGTIDKKCDENMESYVDCTKEREYEASVMTYRFHCNEPLQHVYVAHENSRGAVVGNVRLINSLQFHVQNQQSVKYYLDSYNNRYNDQQQKQITGVKYRGYFSMVGMDATALAVSGNKPVIVQSKAGIGEVLLMAHTDYYTKENIRREVLPGRFSSENIIDVVQASKSSSASLDNPSGLIMQWNLHYNLETQQVQRILNLLKDGAKLIVYITPWSYEENEGLYQDASWLPVLAAAGVWPVENGVIWDSNPMTLGGDDAKAVHSIMSRVKLSDYSLSELEDSQEAFSWSLNLPYSFIHNANLPPSLFEEVRVLLKKWEPRVNHVVPCFNNRIIKESDKKLLLAYNTILLSPFVRDFKAPGYFDYPGHVKDATIVPEVTLRQKITFVDEVIPTGLYAVPGRESLISVIEGSGSDCRMIIGWNFFDSSQQKFYRKWPKTTSYSSYGLHGQIIFTPFGGLIWMQCESAQTIRFKVTNVIKAPIYDIRSDSLKSEWSTRKLSGAPWGIIAGDSAVFVLPSRSLDDIDDPSQILGLYDKAFKAELELAGYSTASRRREVISTDFQIKMGMMHSGYPIGVQIYLANPKRRKSFILNYDVVKSRGNFGLFHEQGHNIVDGAILFEGSAEVFNNIFAIRAEEVLLGIGLYGGTWYKERDVRQYLGFPTFNDLIKKPKLALTPFIQLVDHFGWELMRSFFTLYKNMPSSEKSAIKDKLEAVIINLSKIAKHNLIPFFDFWGFPITQTAKDKLNHLPQFFPDDDITKLSEWKIFEILGTYSGATRRVDKLPVVSPLGPNYSTIDGPQIFLD